MELDSRKKSIRDRMMPSKSFETLEVREIERLSYLMDGNDKRCLPDERKGMQ